MFWEEIKKKNQNILSEKFPFLVVKFSIYKLYLNGRVFVMNDKAYAVYDTTDFQKEAALEKISGGDSGAGWVVCVGGGGGGRGEGGLSCETSLLILVQL